MFRIYQEEEDTQQNNLDDNNYVDDGEGENNFEKIQVVSERNFTPIQFGSSVDGLLSIFIKAEQKREPYTLLGIFHLLKL